MNMHLITILCLVQLLPQLLTDNACEDPKTRNELFLAIANTDRNQKILAGAIQHLDARLEGPEFWTVIANDPGYSKERRRRSAFQLFHRQVAVGIKLSELTSVLGNPRWLEEKHVRIISSLAGKIPVKMTPGNTVVCLYVFPEIPGDKWAIYLSVSGKVDRRAMFAVLAGKQVDNRIKEEKILEVGFDPPFQEKKRGSATGCGRTGRGMR